MPREPPAPVAEIGATLLHDHESGHERPWRVWRVTRDGRACWRFADQDGAHLFSTHLMPYAFSDGLGPEVDRRAAKFGGVRDTTDAGEGALVWPA